MARGKKVKTNEEILAGWMASPHRLSGSYSIVEGLGWEAGQVVPVEVDGMFYERFYQLADGEMTVRENTPFYVVGWDHEGNLVVA